jgi:thiamine biosynthesis lipoprotein
MKKYKFCFFYIFIIVFSSLLTACTNPPAANVERITKNFHLLGTVVTISAYGDQAEEAILAAKERTTAIENLMSVNIKSSEISQLNTLGLTEEVSLGEETFFVLSKALDYAALTDGAFDPAIGQLVDLWSIGTENAKIPSPSEITPYIGQSLYPAIILSEGKARLTSELAKVDLGGIAKGYVGDELRNLLQNEYGIESAFINLGGNVVTLGKKPDGSDWAVGLQDPFAAHRGDTVGIIRIANQSIVSSGSYERFFVEDETIYHHILDLQTGYPAVSDLASSTIITSDGAFADALSTATYILGKDQSLELIESLDGVEAVFITQDKQIFTTSGITDSIFTLTNEGFSYEKTN